MVEKFLPTRLNFDDVERDMAPGEYREAYNLVVASGNKGGLRKSNSLGNILANQFPGLLEGAKCIGGAYQDAKRRAIFFFWQDNGGDDEVVIFYADGSLNLKAPTLTKIVTTQVLGVTSSSYLNNGRFADDLLYFNFSEVDPYVINVKRALDTPGFYDTLSKECFVQLKSPSKYAPVIVRHTLTSPAGDSFVLHKGYQAMIVLNFIDSERSTPSFYSVFLPAIAEEGTSGYDVIRITTYIQPEIFPIVKNAEIYIRNTNNADDWRSIALIKSSQYALSSGKYFNVYDFFDLSSGSFLPEEEALKAIDSVPRRSSSEELLDNRLFLVDRLVDYNEEEGFDFTVALDPSADLRDDRSASSGVDVYTQDTFAWDSSWVYGLIAVDGLGRRIPYSKKNKVLSTPKFPLIDPGTGIPDNPIQKNAAVVTLTGKPPSYAVSMIVARSKNTKWDWQIMQKCLVRFLYQVEPYDGISALPANTFAEDGYIYSSVDGASTPKTGYLDIVLPEDFPFTIDESVIIDFAIQFGAGVAKIQEAPIQKIFANKVRIKGGSWQDVFAFWNEYDHSGTHLKFLSGINLDGGQYPTDDEAFYPIIFKKRVPSNTTSKILYDETIVPIVNPGSANRSFTGTPSPNTDDYDTDKGVEDVNLTVGDGEILIQPFEITPDSIAFNPSITIDWVGLAADSKVYKIKAVLYSLDQATKLPLVELFAGPEQTGLTGSITLFEITDDPPGLISSLETGWYGFGYKVVGVNIPSFLNDEFSDAMANWISFGGSPRYWFGDNDGADFFVGLNYPLGQSDASPHLKQVLSGSPFYQGVEMEVVVETYDVEGLESNTAYTRQPNTDEDGFVTKCIQGDIYIVPMFLDGFTSLLLDKITQDFGGSSGSGAGFFALGQVWVLDQATKQPLSLLFETVDLVELGNVPKEFAFELGERINSSAWYGIGFKIVTAPTTYEFTNNNFTSSLSDWDESYPAEGSTDWYWEAGVAKNTVFPGENKTQGLAPLSALPICYGVEVRVSGSNGTLHILDESLNIIGTILVGAGYVATTIIFPAPLVGEKPIFRYTADSYAGYKTVSIDYVKNFTPILRTSVGAPATADNKYWRYRSGAWTQDAAKGMPTIFDAFDNFSLAPDDLLVKSAGTTGTPVSIAPNTEQTITVIPTSQPSGFEFGVYVENSANNSTAKVRIKSIKNIKVVSGPMKTHGYLMGSIADQEAYKYSAGAWALINRVTGFTAHTLDYDYSSSTLDVDAKPDCYHLALNYLEKGITGHSTDWGAGTPGTPYAHSFPYPSIGPDPDAKGLKYRELIGQSIGIPSAVISEIRERRQDSVVRWSDTIIIGSQLNNLNSFREGNKYTIDFTRGPIVKLLSMNDNTLVCLHESGMTSLYVNKILLKQQDGSEQLIGSNKVVGSDRELYTELGTVNPESVVLAEKGNIAYGFDLRRASAWQKSNNGVRNLTEESKAISWFTARANERIPAMNAGVDVKIYGGYNAKIKTYFLTFAAFSYDGIDYPAYTIGWSALMNNGAGGFCSLYSFAPATYMTEADIMFSVFEDGLWIHDHAGFVNKFYGVQYNSSIKILLRQADDLKKIYDNIAIDTNSPWKVTQIRTSAGQVSALEYENFKEKKDRFYADFLRDMNTPADVLAAGETPLLNGHQLEGNWIEITLVNESTTERVVLDAIYLGFTDTGGHLLNK